MTLAELAVLLGAELRGDGSLEVNGVAEPGAARPGDVALLTDPRRRGEAPQSQATAFVVRRAVEDLDRPQLVCHDPARALALLVDRFGAPASREPTGVDARAAVAPDAEVPADAWVGPFAYVGPRARIGVGSRIEPFSYIGAGVSLGRGCRVGPGAVVLPGSHVGDGVSLGPGAVIGHRGFGFWRDERGWHPIPSPGGVSLGDDVEVGANACVDAGTLGPTQLAPGAKLDNLVQVGHNCRIGERALLCGQVGLAGSVRVGPDSLIGGQAGVADHLVVGEGARVAAHSGVARDVAPKATVAGYPALPHQTWLRSSALLARLAELFARVRELSEMVGRTTKR